MLSLTALATLIIAAVCIASDMIMIFKFLRKPTLATVRRYLPLTLLVQVLSILYFVALR